MRSAALTLLAAWSLASACSSSPELVPDALRVTVVDASTLRVDGRTLDWEGFDGYVRQRIVELRERGIDKPTAFFDAYKSVDPRYSSRAIDLLGNAGVRTIEILPARD